MSAKEGTVLLEDRGAIRVLTLNRPERKNAIDLEMRVALAEALEAAGADEGVRVVVITGAGGAFCSGGDISTMAALTRPQARERAEAAQRVVRAIWSIPQPVLAAVEGPAYGAGTALAAACDRVVSASNATYSTTFTAVGLAGDMGINASLPLRVGTARARQMLMLPSPVRGEEALAIGLVDCLVEPGAALERAMQDAERLAAGPAQALGVIKRMLTGIPRDPFALLDIEAENQADLWVSADFAEGVSAFREKRVATFGST
jgi:enoyl-CoA hydratase/carnithine racemase